MVTKSIKIMMNSNKKFPPAPKVYVVGMLCVQNAGKDVEFDRIVFLESMVDGDPRVSSTWTTSVSNGTRYTLLEAMTLARLWNQWHVAIEDGEPKVKVPMFGYEWAGVFEVCSKSEKS